MRGSNLVRMGAMWLTSGEDLGGSDRKESAFNAEALDFLGWENPMEEGLATHSSIRAWRIPRPEAPGGLQSVGSQRVRHD